MEITYCQWKQIQVSFDPNALGKLASYQLCQPSKLEKKHEQSYIYIYLAYTCDKKSAHPVH